MVTQTVVTYNVVLLIDNRDGKLKPGMTADVNIVVSQRQNVLRVPRAALRFTPPPAARLENPEAVGKATVVVWTLQHDGRLQAIPITPGISDETYTEVCDGALAEGDAVIIEATEEQGAGSQLLGPSVLPQPKRF